MMQFTIYNFVLYVHIISGFLGLLCGTIAIMKTNFIKTHKKAGKIFFYAMVFIFITSTIMCFLKTNVFLLLVGFFSFYLACTGYRALQLKAIYKNNLKPQFIDYAISITGILAGISIYILAYFLFIQGSNFGFVCVMLGSVSLFLGILDIRKFYIIITDKFFWMRAHAIRMAGAYAATVTAFIVVNVQINQGWTLWILPSFIIIPIAFRIINRKVNNLQNVIKPII